jgi:hypothetical protein
MSSASPRNRKPSPYVCGRDTPWQPGDEAVGIWPRERLVAMNRRFVERVEHAFENGSESRQSAAMNGANASQPRYR